MTRPDTLFDRIRSAFLWTVGVCWLAPLMSTLMAATLIVPTDRTQWLDRLYCWGQVRLTGSSWRAVVHPDVRPDRPYLFVQNHVNLLDHVTMYNATPHFKQGVELAAHFRIPFYGWMMRRRGTLPVDPADRRQTELLRRFREEVERGHSILAFPEGTRTRSGRVGKFRRGLFYLAVEMGLPIVPVSVVGMYEVLRTGSWVMRPGAVTVYCDAPVETAGVKREDVAALTERVQAIVAARVDQHFEASHG
jgi:1-acyl-sn-glycerol-3-phosphate acyltransferase